MAEQQSILISGRQRVEITGVKKVDDFDKSEILLETNLGALQIKGEDLHIAELLLEEGRLVAEGEICSTAFVEPRGSRAKKKGTSLRDRIIK